MTMATDFDNDEHRLSPTARRMLELQDRVFSEWEKRLRESVKEAAKLPHPVLINTFPVLYANIVEAISPDHPRLSVSETSTVASEHGGERARLTDYSCMAVVTQYQLLRWTILDILNEAHVQISDEEFKNLNVAIDSAVLQSVNAFALSQAALREQFVIALAHDLRNPLQVIGSAAEIIGRTEEVDRIHLLAQQIAENRDRMDQMIRQLLDGAMLRSGRRMSLQLSRFDITDVVTALCRQQGVWGDFRIEVEAVPTEGWWDRSAIERALANLLGNAVKYGDPAWPIRVTTQAMHERLLLAVHNRGEPIPPEQWESVFQVFNRGEAAQRSLRTGWGIGLPYVRSVAESHGGSVQLDSSPDSGTTVSIAIPLDARSFQDAPTLEGF